MLFRTYMNHPLLGVYPSSPGSAFQPPCPVAILRLLSSIVVHLVLHMSILVDSQVVMPEGAFGIVIVIVTSSPSNFRLPASWHPFPSYRTRHRRPGQ